MHRTTLIRLKSLLCVEGNQLSPNRLQPLQDHHHKTLPSSACVPVDIFSSHLIKVLAHEQARDGKENSLKT